MSALQMPPITRMIAEAAQRYGFIVNDQTAATVGFRAEDPTPLMRQGLPNPYLTYFANPITGEYEPPNELLASFPWADLGAAVPGSVVHQAGLSPAVSPSSSPAPSEGLSSAPVPTSYHVMSVVGARPNFMKTVPVIAALQRRSDPVQHTLVHTGQHYDDAMSRIFLEELGVGAPDIMLSVGSATHAVQTARVMERIEPVMMEFEPDFVLVPGDVNSTLAAALVAAKLGIPIGHIEAGLRSFDRTMPEEINRVLTDQISDLLFIHSPEARENLVAEGVSPDRVHSVGNTMIDTLVAMRSRIREAHAADRHGLELRLVPGRHPPPTGAGRRATACRCRGRARRGRRAICRSCSRFTLVREASMQRQGLSFSIAGRASCSSRLGYVEFLSLVQDSAGVLTDSGGMQEETTYLGIPCFTLRDNTERPVTCELGTNVLLGLAPRANQGGAGI